MAERSVYRIVFLSIFLRHCSSFTMCPRVCDVSKCSDSISCEHGYVLDRCDCCKTCVRDSGEECGGQFDRKGVCMNGLECQQRMNDGGFHCRTPPGQRCKDAITGNTKAAGEVWYASCLRYECQDSGEIRATVESCHSLGCDQNNMFDPCCEVCHFKVAVTCDHENMRVVVPRLLLPETSIQQLSLPDEACSGDSNGTHYTFRASLLDCGTEKEIDKNNIVYKSYLKNIETGQQLLDFKCLFKKAQQEVQTYVTINRGVIETNAWMRYTTPYGKVLTNSSRIQVNSGTEIYLELSPPKALRTFNVRMVPNRCHLARNITSPSLFKGDVILDGGCAARGGVNVLLRGDNLLWFSVKVEESRTLETYFINCDVLLCSKNSSSPKCRIECAEKNQALITRN